MSESSRRSVVVGMLNCCLTVKVYLSFCLCLSLYLSRSVCLSVWLSVSVSLSLCLSLCLFHCFSLCLCMSLSLSVSVSVAISVYDFLSVYVSVCVSISFYLSLRFSRQRFQANDDQRRYFTIVLRKSLFPYGHPPRPRDTQDHANIQAQPREHIHIREQGLHNLCACAYT